MIWLCLDKKSCDDVPWNKLHLIWIFAGNFDWSTWWIFIDDFHVIFSAIILLVILLVIGIVVGTRSKALDLDLNDWIYCFQGTRKCIDWSRKVGFEVVWFESSNDFHWMKWDWFGILFLWFIWWLHLSFQMRGIRKPINLTHVSYIKWFDNVVHRWNISEIVDLLMESGDCRNGKSKLDRNWNFNIFIDLFPVGIVDV